MTTRQNQCLSISTILAPRFSYCQRFWKHGSSMTSRFSSLVHPLICILNRNEVLLRLSSEILHVNPESSDLSALFLQSRTRYLIKDTFNSRDSSSFYTPCQRINFAVNTFQIAEWQDRQEAVTVHSACFLGCWFPAVGGLASPPLRVHLSREGLGLYVGGYHWNLVEEAKDADKHHTRHRTAPRNKELSNP